MKAVATVTGTQILADVFVMEVRNPTLMIEEEKAMLRSPHVLRGRSFYHRRTLTMLLAVTKENRVSTDGVLDTVLGSIWMRGKTNGSSGRGRNPG